MFKYTLISILLAATTLFFTSCTDPEQVILQQIMNARQLEQDGKLQEATIQLEQLNEKYPGRQDILEPLAFAYARQNAHSFAAKAFSQIAEIQADNNLYFLHAADHYALAGNDEQAISFYIRFLSYNRQDTDTMNKLSQHLLRRNRYQEAIDYLLQKQKLDPSGDTSLSLGHAFLALSNLTQAQHRFEDALNSGAQWERDARIGLVEVAVLNNQLDEAEKHLNILKTKYPQSLQSDPLKSLLVQMEEFRKERDLLHQILQDNQTETPVAEEVVVVEEASTVENVAPTATETEKVVEVEVVEASVTEPTPPANTPEETSVVVSIAKTDLPPALLAEVEATLQEETVVETEPTIAEEIVEVEVTPKIDTTDLEQARQQVQQGNHQVAADLYWKFLSRHDEDPVVWSELSNAFLQLNQLLAARAAILEASRRDPTNLQYVFQNLKILQRLETPERFLRELQQARTRYPRSSDIALTLARTYSQSFNDQTNSEFFYREFLRLASPEHPARQEAESILGISSF